MATVVIAEAGVNHNGDMAIARRLIECAAEAGADAVKFQTFSATDLTTPEAPKATYQLKNDCSKSQLEMLKKLELSKSQFQELKEHCHKCEIDFLSTAFGNSQLELLLQLGVSAIKVPSGEITHLQLLRGMSIAAITHHLPVYLSTGMSNLGEVEAALKVFLDAGVNQSDVTLLHCLSAYPAPQEQVNLLAMKTLADAFSCPVGYSDHTLGITAPICAVSLGAKVIEKHLTIDQNLEGPDHKASLEPKLFKAMVEAIRNTESLLGDGQKRAQSSELETRHVARRSLRAAHPIKNGQLIQPQDLIAQRPADGLSPMAYDQIVGQKATKDYQISEPFGLIP